MITGRTSGSNFSYAGLDPSEILQKVKAGRNDFGFNAKNDKYEHLLETGIIDPLKISRLALEYAASVAGMFITTECVIVKKPDWKKATIIASSEKLYNSMITKKIFFIEF